MHHMPLIEFLTARLDEEEKAARAAMSSQADPENGWSYEKTQGQRDGGVLTPHVGIAHEDTQGTHIAYWHPYRVLADIEAKRRLIAFHEKWPMLVEQEEPEPPSVITVPSKMAEDMDFNRAIATMQKRIVWLENQEYRKTFGDEPPTWYPLLAIAQVYRDHPAWDEEWTLKEEA